MFELFYSIQEDLIPHVPLLILFTTSAQTNIFPEIRIDAVRLLDLFLELVPETVVSGWMEENSGHGRRVLEGYLGILNAGTKYGGTEGKELPKVFPTLTSRCSTSNIDCQCSPLGAGMTEPSSVRCDQC